MIRRTRPEEWARLRDLRLRALADAPEAFAATLAEEETQPEAYWRERAAAAAFVAEEGPRWLGTATAFEASPGAWEIVSVWVAPEARRRGIARALVEAALAHARRGGGRVVGLRVEAGNEAALRLYLKLGFREAGAPGASGTWLERAP